MEHSGATHCSIICRKSHYPYSKMCELCELCELLERKNPIAKAVGFSYFFSAEFIRLFGDPKELCSNGERKNDGALISIHRNPLAKSILTRGIFRRWLLSCILMSDIVRLLERAEEGCEGLKHGYYDLPCVHFLIFLCHSGDIRLVRCLASPPSRLQNHRR